MFTDLDVLVELKRLCKGQFFVDIQQIVDGVIVDLEVRTSDNKDALLLTLRVFDPLEKFLQCENEDSITVEVVDLQFLPIGRSVLAVEFLQWLIQVRIERVGVHHAVPLVIPPLLLGACQHRREGRYHRNCLLSRGYRQRLANRLLPG